MSAAKYPWQPGFKDDVPTKPKPLRPQLVFESGRISDCGTPEPPKIGCTCDNCKSFKIADGRRSHGLAGDIKECIDDAYAAGRKAGLEAAANWVRTLHADDHRDNEEEPCPLEIADGLEAKAKKERISK